MKLAGIEIEGYKRFREKQALNTDARTIALLGPNEAGKSSLLRALLSLNNKTPFIASGPAQELTRGVNIPPNKPILTAKFLLEKGDVTAIKDVPKITDPRWFVVDKLANGQFRCAIHPAWGPDIEYRSKVLQQLEKFYTIDSNSTVIDLVLKTIMSSLPNVLGKLRSSLQDERFSADIIEQLRSFGGAFTSTKDKSLKPLADSMLELARREELSDPSARVCEILLARIPHFILFEDQDRNLASNYQLASFFDGKDKQPIPRALENLAATAEISLENLFSAGKANDRGLVETIQSTANEVLKAKLEESWSQSKMQVRLHLDGTQLSILAASNKGGFEAISERSDGLRQFVALFSLFSSRSTDTNRGTCLLIDELEHRLHYDAQADLVQMLTKQKFANKVLYTTHSLGCLPEDLGLGVRMVQPAPDNSSAIENKFWTHGAVGFSPLLVGMGAATMAFLPVRYCILVEGASDIVLLPSLFREALQKETLGFQISPGLSEASEERLSLLKSEGKRVLYLVDGDKGGQRIANRLQHIGVPVEKILWLVTPTKAPLVTEDLINKKIYTSAINEELQRSGVSVKVTEEIFGDNQRPTALKKWAEDKDISLPSKVEIAYRVVERCSTDKIVDPTKIDTLSALHGEIVRRFEK